MEANEPILEIDNTQSATELEAQNHMLFSLRALEKRLEAERDGQNSLIIPLPLILWGARAKRKWQYRLRFSMQGARPLTEVLISSSSA